MSDDLGDEAARLKNAHRAALKDDGDIVPSKVRRLQTFDFTRREVLVGAGGVSAAYATGAVADAVDRHGWRFATSPDPDYPGRVRAEVQFDGSRVLTLREAAFGERARFGKRPIPKASCKSDQPPDRRLVVNGAQLIGGETFTLLMDFRSCDRGDPSLNLSAYGWVFGGSATVPSLLASGPVPQFDGGKPVPVLSKHAKAANTLAEKLLNATFGPLATRGASAAPMTVGVSIESDGGRVVWSLSTHGKADRFIVPLRQKGSLAHESDAESIVRAETLAMWRRVDPPLSPTPDAAETCRQDGVGDLSDGAKIAAETVRASERTGPRTIAILGGVVFAERALLGVAARADGPISFLGMSSIAVPRCSAFALRLSRSKRAGDEGTGDVIKAEIPVAGDLSITTAEKAKGGGSVVEGPFRAVDGLVELSVPAAGSSIVAEGRFVLSTKAFSAVTSWAPFSLARPEACVDCDAAKASPSAITKIVDGRIRAFEIVARAFDAGVAISETGASPATPFMPSRSFATRLDFPGGVEILFRLQGADDAEGRAPRLGFVTLGVLKSTVSMHRPPGALFQVPLESGVLRITRWTDLMALTFRFSGLDLVGDGAAFSLRARGLSRVAAAPSIRGADGDLLEDAQLRGACAPERAQPNDMRPLMVVEFPPQHVAEEAFFTRTKSRPTLPEPPALTRAGQSKIRVHLRTLRSAYKGKPADAIAAKRLTAREEIRKVYLDPNLAAPKHAPDPAVPAVADLCQVENLAASDYATFAGLLENDVDAAALPKEQRIYIGADWLDAGARRVAERVATRVAAAKSHRLPDELPEDPLDRDEVEAVKADLKDQGTKRDDELRKRRLSRDPFFVSFKTQYERDLPAGGTYAKRIPQYAGRAELQRRLFEEKAFCAPAANDLGVFVGWLSDLLKSVSKQLNVSGVEDPTLPAKARISGPSRLAFRINTDEGEDGPPGGAVPFTIEGLTNWGRFDLAVVRRAEKLFETYSDGSRRPNRDRREDGDLFRQLEHQGFSKGGAFKDGKCSPVERLLQIPSAEVSAAQRLAEVVAGSTAAPTDFETAIELPFRLLLSPSQDARFRTRRPVPSALFGSEVTPVAGAEATKEPLWTAEQDLGGTAKLRAVWSPDFRPEAFLAHTTQEPSEGARSNRAPLRGPYAPWNLPRDLTPSDPKFEQRAAELTRFRTSLDAFDRHELVALSSLHGLPVLGRVTPAGGRVGADQREPPGGFKVAGLRGTRPIDGPDLPSAQWPDMNDVYIPRSLPADELALSSLGGFLKLDAEFEPPAAARLLDGTSLFDALSIERWKHRIVLGRDVSAEILYKGYLFPIGLRAALVKITERRFERVVALGPPVAVLRQRMFLRVAKPVKAFPAFRQPNGGRRFPFAQAELITTQSPDLVDPFDYSGQAVDGVLPSGLVQLQAALQGPSKPKEARGSAFWPRTARRPGAEVLFDVTLGSATTRIPFIFVDNVAVNNDAAMEALCTYYNGLSAKAEGANPTSRRRLVTAPLGGTKVRYASELKPGDTEFETNTITLSAEGKSKSETNSDVNFDPYAVNIDYEVDAFMNGLDQPPFYPAIRRANVKIGQLERLAGRPVEPADVAYDATYTVFGFDGDGGDSKNNPRSIFLDLVSTPVSLRFEGSGDRGGAVGRPELNVVALSRSNGVIGSGDAAKGAQPEGSKLPAVASDVKTQSVGAFFSGSAKLLGVVTFKDLLEAVIGAAVEPKLREIVDYAGDLADQGAASLKTSVIEPLSRRLDELNDRLSSLEVQGTTGSQALAAAYPEFFAAFQAFEKSLKDALSAPPPTESGAAISAYSEVYETGRRFIETALRVARDPITPLRAAAEQAFHEKFASIAGDIEKVASLVATFKDFVEIAGRRAIKDVIVDEVMLPLSSGIFALPPPEGVDASAPSEKLEAAIADAIAEALRDETKVWPGVADPRLAFFNAAAFSDRLKAALKARAEGTLKDALNAQADALSGRFQGFLWPLAQRSIEAAEAAVRSFAESFDLGKLSLYVAEIGAAIDEARSAFEQLKDLSKLTGLACISAAKALSDLLRVATPAEKDATEEPADCSTPTSGCLKAASYPTGPYALYPAVYRLQKGLDSLLGGTDVIFAKVKQRLQGSALLIKLDHLESLVSSQRSAINDLAKDLAESAKTLDRAVDQFAVEIKVVQDELASASSCGASAGATLKFVRLLPSLVKGVNDARLPLGIAVATAAKSLSVLLAAPFATDAAVSAGVPVSSADYSGDPTSWSREAWIDDAQVTIDDVYQTLRLKVVTLVAPAIHAALSLMGHISTAGAWIDLKPDQPFAAKAAAAVALKTSLVSLDAVFAGAGEPFKSTFLELKTAYANADAGASIVRQLAARLQKKLDAAAALKTAIEGAKLDEAKNAVVTIVEAVDNPELPEPRAVAQSLLGALDENGKLTKPLMEGIEQARRKTKVGAEAIEARALSLLTALLFDVDKVYRKLLVQALPVATKVAGGLEKLFGEARSKRDQLLGAVGTGPLTGKLKGMLAAPDVENGDFAKDGLAQQHERLKKLSARLAVPGDDAAQAVAELLELVKGWREGNDPKKANAILVILFQVRNASEQLLRGNVAAVIDVDSIRREVEAQLKQMIPSKITLAYDFETELTKEVAGGLFKPGSDCTLKLAARTVTDVLKGGATQASVIGDLGPFSIKLLPIFDVVTLNFNGARYTNGIDGGGKFSIQFADFEFGPMASFLEALSSYISFGDSGFYLAIRGDIPSKAGFDFGIEAGYRMAPINLSIGTLSFINVSLNASCVLPFGESEATFKVGVSRPEAPFLITAFPFGGSGHLALYASAKGMIGFEASFAFGAAAAFAFGPLVGQGFIMAGIFLRNIKVAGDKTASTLEGYFIASGSARIACFSTSTSLTIKFGQQPSGKMAGSAVFTFSFSLGVKDIEFRFTAYKEEGKGFSSPRQSARLETVGPTRYACLCASLSDATVARDKASAWSAMLNVPKETVALLTSAAVCKGQDFHAYQSYFSDLEPWAPI